MNSGWKQGDIVYGIYSEPFYRYVLKCKSVREVCLKHHIDSHSYQRHIHPLYRLLLSLCMHVFNDSNNSHGIICFNSSLPIKKKKNHKKLIVMHWNIAILLVNDLKYFSSFSAIAFCFKCPSLSTSHSPTNCCDCIPILVSFERPSSLSRTESPSTQKEQKMVSLFGDVPNCSLSVYRIIQEYDINN